MIKFSAHFHIATVLDILDQKTFNISPNFEPELIYPFQLKLIYSMLRKDKSIIQTLLKAHIFIRIKMSNFEIIHFQIWLFI